MKFYSGTLMVRTSSDLHQRLSEEAARQGVSLNQWCVQALAESLGRSGR